MDERRGGRVVMTTREHKPRVAVISTVHDTYDTRIFYKQIPSLRGEFDVIYLTPVSSDPGLPGVIPLRKSTSKLGRLWTHLSLLRALVGAKADLYLLHDPELLPLGLLLKLLGRRVVWDMHEDTYNDIKTKGYLGPLRRVLFAEIYRLFQVVSYYLLDGFLLAEDAYQSYFPRSTKTCVVHNYPLLDRLRDYIGTPKDEHTLVYIGSISVNRGVRELLELVRSAKESLPGIRLLLIGPFTDDALEASTRRYVAEHELSDNVIIQGPVRNVEAYPLLARCKLGVALLLPEPNFRKSLPTKMFEYMALGLPVVVSDFPLWKEIVDMHGVGYAVDPTDAPAVVAAVRRLLTDDALYREMSVKAAYAAQEYSWETEGRRMVGFLNGILNA
ncbi:MAG: glycosyltransferase [Methylotetracoccus sp.]